MVNQLRTNYGGSCKLAVGSAAWWWCGVCDRFDRRQKLMECVWWLDLKYGFELFKKTAKIIGMFSAKLLIICNKDELLLAW